MPTSSRASSPVEVPEYNTQFEPRPDDQETLWSVLEIIREEKRRYLVKWDGLDPDTGKPWAPSWVPKTDCTDDLIHEWKLTKAKKTKKKRLSKTDPDYDPKPPGKTSRSKSLSVTTSKSSHKPSSTAGPSKLRMDKTISPVVEIIRSNKRQRKNHRLDAEHVAEGDTEHIEPPKKKRKLVARGGRSPDNDEVVPRHKTSKPLPISPSTTHTSRDADQQASHESLSRSPIRRRDQSEREGVSSSKKNTTKSAPQKPSLGSYEVDPHRKIGKHPVIVSSQESDASTGVLPSHADDNDPVERSSQSHNHLRDLPQTDMYDDQTNEYMDDNPEIMVRDGVLPTPDARTFTPPSPSALLRPRNMDTVIPETQPSAPTSPQPQRKPPTPQLKPKPRMDLVPAHKRASKTKNRSRPLRPVPSIPTSKFIPLILDPPTSSIDISSSPRKSTQDKGKIVNKGPAFSQRQEDEESESGNEALENEVDDAIEDDEDEIVQHAIDVPLRQHGHQLSEDAALHARSQLPPKPAKKPLSEVLSARSRSASNDHLSDENGNEVDPVEPEDDGVQENVREITTGPNHVRSRPQKRAALSITPVLSSESAEAEEEQDDKDQIDRSIDESTSGLQGEEDESSHYDYTDGTSTSHDDESVEHDSPALHENPADELRPEDAPDARSHTPPPWKAPLSGSGSTIFPPSGGASYSHNATGPWSQNPVVSVQSPTRQLDSALGLLNKKSEEIYELQDNLEAEYKRVTELKTQVQRLKHRLGVVEHRYGEVSAALDVEREAKKVAEELETTARTAGSTDAERLVELLQENEQLKAANGQLTNDADMLRRLYTQASNAHQERLGEIQELTRDNESLRVQATMGVKQAGAFWQTQVRTLETELAQSRGKVKILTDQAQRTGDDVRRRAALLPMARQEADDARADVELLEENMRALGRENTRLRVEVKGWEDDAMARRKKERDAASRKEEASVGDELVWMCPWMDAEHQTKCGALLESREKLREHLYMAGHI